MSLEIAVFRLKQLKKEGVSNCIENYFKLKKRGLTSL